MKRNRQTIIFSRKWLILPFLLCLGMVHIVMLNPRVQAFQDNTGEEKEAEDPKEGEEPEEEKPLPKLSEMELPSVEQLLQKPRVDWVVLKNEDVIVVEPITLRPDTLLKLESQLVEIRKEPRPKTEEGKADRQERVKALLAIEIVIIDGGEEPEYRIKTKDIKEIIYHEDLLLRRISQLLEEGKFRTAHEMFFNLIRQLPNWPGIKKVQQDLLFFEAEDRLKRNEPQGALAYLENLYRLNRKYPKLLQRLGEVNNDLIEEALKSNDHQQARYFLTRFQKLEPKHKVTIKWVNYLQELSRKYLLQALAAEKKKQYPQAAIFSEKAIDYWPKTPGVRTAYRKLNRRFQRIRVGVLHFHNDPTPYFLPTDAQRRHQRLTTSQMFELDHNDETAHYRSPLFEQWEPTDLGRRATFKLKQKLAPWESRSVITASAVVGTLNDYINPQSKNYDEQLDNYVRSIKVLSPFEFQIQFSRVPYRIEPLLTKTITTDIPQDNSADNLINTSAQNQQRTLLSKRFQIVKQEEDHIIYRRTVPEYDGLPIYHTAEITEVKQASHEQALQSLFRGDVALLSSIQPWHVDSLKGFSQFDVLKYSMPATHVIQINPLSKTLKSHELRRALAYSLDRKKMLSEIVLQDPQMKYGRIISAPYSKTNYAYHNLMKPRPYDLALGFTLGMLVKKRKEKAKKEFPVLKMLVPNDPDIEAVTREIVKRWKLIGIPIEIVKDAQFKTDASSNKWDLIYRKVKMAEPATDLWSFLIVRDHAHVEALRHLPDWLRQELVDLDNVTNYDDIVAKLHVLHKHLQTETFLIPLWEVDEFLVKRKYINGMPAHPISLYQDVEQWIQILP